MMCADKPDPSPIVLGAQLAAARKAETARIAEGNILPSPIGPNMRYVYAGAMEAIDPHWLPLDDKLTEICRRFAGSDATARETTRTSVSMDDFYTLFDFARRSAVFALRDNQSSHIIDGLTAIAIIELKRVDFRDALVPLAVLYNAAIKIGVNPDALVRRAIALSEPDTSAVMEGFIDRSPDDKDLSKWGYAVVETENGPGLVASRFKPYAPTCPMDRIAFELAQLIEADKYRAGVELQTDLPSFWLSGVDDRNLAQALHLVVAGAHVRGYLRPDPSPQVRGDLVRQMLLLFLVELADQSTAESLDALARAKSTRENSFAMLAIRNGRLFCLVISSSAVYGENPFETASSLARFGPGIEAILRAHN
jgi:hypothetical protein